MQLKNNKLLSVLKIIVNVLLVIILAVVLVFGFLAIKEYKPEPVEVLTSQVDIDFSKNTEVPLNTELNFVTLNVGYGALGDNADFFMDGGRQVYTASKARVTQNMSEIISILKKENPDFVFLQEVDVNSARSYSLNEKEEFQKAFPEYDAYFGINFKVPFVPYPLPPIGKVFGGIETLSRYKINQGVRIALPCPFKIPVRYGNLKRCLLETRIKVAGSDKELVLINLHLEAYDSGEGKIAQTKVVKEYIMKELEKGNYVIVGGDFNQTFSNVVLSEYPHIDKKYWRAGLVNVGDYSKELQFLMDNSVPTCRSLDKAYAPYADDAAKRKQFQFYMIDGFIVSSNVNVKKISTLNYNFKSTDHNPVKLVFELN